MEFGRNTLFEFNCLYCFYLFKVDIKKIDKRSFLFHDCNGLSTVAVFFLLLFTGIRLESAVLRRIRAPPF